MSKNRTVKWLESQTGESLVSAESNDESRHLSLRIPVSLFERLEALAAQNSESVSQTARRLLDRGVGDVHDPDRDAIDQAIATLEHLRAKLPSTAA
jgi:predicted DNA-binding protein